MSDEYIFLDFSCPTCKKRIEVAKEICPDVVWGGEPLRHYWCECREDFGIPTRFTQPKTGEEWEYYCAKHRANWEANMQRLHAGEKFEPEWKHDFLALRKPADSSHIKPRRPSTRSR
jgi:hypothetical protein